MKISLITVCLNSSSTIESTLKSVLSQKYTNYEYIIKDGESSDDTLKIIKKYEKKFKGKLHLISCEDKGIYDAINMALDEVSGDVVGILNSDDILADEYSFNKIIDNISDVDGVYSNLLFLDYKNMSKIKRKITSRSGNYKLGWYPPHPTLYLKKEVYDRYGYFNTKYKVASDYDYMLRIMIGNVKLKYINTVLVHMRNNGISTRGLKGYKNSFFESIKVLKNNKVKHPYFINIIRVFKVILQYIRR